MARFCRACGRPLDAEHHDIGKAPRYLLERNRLVKAKDYGCKVRLIATNPVTGKRFVPSHPQRIKKLDVKYVHESNLEAV